MNFRTCVSRETHTQHPTLQTVNHGTEGNPPGGYLGAT